jgi:GAF domain-containing protein
MNAPLEQPASDPARVRLARLERLQELTEALSAALTPEAVGAIIFDLGLGLVAAHSVTLFWETRPGTLELVHGLGLSDSFVQRFRTISSDAALPSAEAYRTGEPVWLGSREAIASRCPELAAFVEAEGDHAWAALPLVVDRSRGAIGLRFDAPRTFDAEERAFVVAVARQCAQALERARLYDAQRRLADRVATLQGTTSALSAAVTPAEVGAIVFRALLALGATEGALFHLPAGADTLDLVFCHGLDGPLRQRLAHLPLDAHEPPAAAVRTGAPVWLEDEAAVRADDRPAAQRGRGGWVALPLRAEGRSVGALMFSMGTGRVLADEQRTDALALAQQCAQALERARLFEAQKRLAERLSKVHATAAALSGAATPREVAEAAFGAIGALGACGAEIHALDGGERLVLLARHGRSAEEASISVETPVPPAEVLRTGRALWLSSREGLAERYPAWAADPARAREQAWAVVPLLASGTTLGTFTVAFGEERRLDAEDRSFVRLIAQPCAEALERARLTEAAAHRRGSAASVAAVVDAMVEAAPLALALLDRDMRYVRVNRRYARRSGISAEAHVGRTPREVLPGTAGAQAAAAFRDVLESGAAEEVLVVGETPGAPGTTRRWIESWYPVRVAGEIVAVAVAVRQDAAPA